MKLEKLLARRKTQIKAYTMEEINDVRNLSALVRSVFGSDLKKITPLSNYSAAVTASFACDGEANEAIVYTKRIVDKLKREYGLNLEDIKKNMFSVGDYGVSMCCATLFDSEYGEFHINIETIAGMNYGSMIVSFIED